MSPTACSAMPREDSPDLQLTCTTTTCEPRCRHRYASIPLPASAQVRPPVLRSMRCRSLSRVRVSASCLAGDSCIEVRSEIVGMRLVCHDLEWHADRACHEKCTDCTTKSKAVRTADAAVGRCSLSFAERVMQELVQGPRRLIQAFPGPSESESRKTSAFAPTASLHDSPELSARAVGDELRRIVALTIQKQARSTMSTRSQRAGVAGIPADRRWVMRWRVVSL